MNAEEYYSVANTHVDFAAVFSRESIITFPHNVQKSEVLASLVTSLAHAGRLSGTSVVGIINELQERERYGTTGLGKGLALPHIRSRHVADFVGAIGVAPTGIDFDSLDGLPTRLIILLLSPFDQRARHTEIMGRLATLLSDKTLQYFMRRPRSREALLRFLGF